MSTLFNAIVRVWELNRLLVHRQTLSWMRILWSMWEMARKFSWKKVLPIASIFVLSIMTHSSGSSLMFTALIVSTLRAQITNGTKQLMGSQDRHLPLIPSLVVSEFVSGKLLLKLLPASRFRWSFTMLISILSAQAKQMNTNRAIQSRAWLNQTCQWRSRSRTGSERQI